MESRHFFLRRDIGQDWGIGTWDEPRHFGFGGDETRLRHCENVRDLRHCWDTGVNTKRRAETYNITLTRLLKAHMKKALGDTQRNHCALAVVRRSQKNSPRRRPPRILGAQDGQNLISWRWSLPSPTDPVLWWSMHAISSYRGNRQTHKQSHPHTNKQDR